LLRYNDPEHSIESPRGHGGVLAFALRVFYGHGLVLYDFPDLVFLFVLFVCFSWMWNSVIIDGGNVSRSQHQTMLSTVVIYSILEKATKWLINGKGNEQKRCSSTAREPYIRSVLLCSIMRSSNLFVTLSQVSIGR
jgi:hypothetical protein